VIIFRVIADAAIVIDDQHDVPGDAPPHQPVHQLAAAGAALVGAHRRGAAEVLYQDGSHHCRPRSGLSRWS
jgi:hypothetical protein